LVPAFQANPLCPPIAGLKQPHRPLGGLAPTAWLAVLIPDADLPEARCVRAQLFAAVRQQDGLIRCDFAGVPKVRLALGESSRAAGNQDLAGGLALAPFAGGKNPTEARLGGSRPCGFWRYSQRNSSARTPAFTASTTVNAASTRQSQPLLTLRGMSTG
jgi:hypothetical protein